ncbi:hypothetical protein ES703_61579 [subsurface metagenome]
MATARYQDYAITIYRLGDRYYKRIVYFDLAFLVERMRERLAEWQLNQGEWFHLQDLAAKGSGEKGISAQDATEKEQLSVDKKDYEWALEDFLNAYAGEKPIKDFKIAAYGSEIACPRRYSKEGYWLHVALLYEDNVRYAAIRHSGNDGKTSFDWLKSMQARSLYHNAKNKIIPYRELFPDAKPYPWEKKYLSQGEA